jgi:two-component system chemotaxis response regulator CheB
VLARLPEDFPVPIVIAQHIADGFVPGLVSWLDSGCPVKVVAAQDGETIAPGHAYFAPTGLNMRIDGTAVHFEPPQRGQLYIPSADTLFESVLRSHGGHSVGIILTGMGADGADGLKRLHDAGAFTIAQDEASCTIFGMPKAAIDLGAVDKVLAPQEIAETVLAAMTTV